jgi:uroporphyrinogen decarboxylase
MMTALNHQTPDRVPMDLGGTRVTSVSAVMYKRLKAHFGIKRETRIIDGIMQTAAVDEEILQALDIDTRLVIPGAPDQVRDKRLPDGRWVDEWGVTRRLSPDGYYYDLDISPFSGEPDISVLDDYLWPDVNDKGRYRNAGEQARHLHEDTDYAVVAHVPGGWIHISQYMRGFEGWYADLALRPEFMLALMTRIRNVTLEMARRFLNEVGPYVDVIATGDDIGAQRSLMVSPNMYREQIYPLQKEQFQTFRSLTDAKIFYHTCGDVYPVLHDIIDMGVDILNPVQVSASEMGDTARLKREVGNRLSFWGGIDTFQVLPHGSVDDVKAEVERRVRDLGVNGGYVLCPVHNVQPDVSVENLLAVYESGKQVRLT